MTCLFFAWDSRLFLNNSYSVAEDSVLNIHRVCLFTSSSLLRTDSVQHAIQNRTWLWILPLTGRPYYLNTQTILEVFGYWKELRFHLNLLSCLCTHWRTPSGGQKVCLLLPGPGLHILNVDLPLNFLINKMVEMVEMTKRVLAW